MIPAAIKLAMHQNLTAVRDSVNVLKNSYAAKAEEYRDAVKVSRTLYPGCGTNHFRTVFLGRQSLPERQAETLMP